jgi:uncharacterized phage-like protein YoqJ
MRVLARTSLELLAPTELYDGMALGWDQACLLGALDLGIPVVACLPFEGMENKWGSNGDTRWRDWFRKQLSRCHRVHVCCDRFSRAAYQIRNEYMCDSSQRLLALWDGGHGGTANCVRYARGEIAGLVSHETIREAVPVDNVWTDWVASGGR